MAWKRTKATLEEAEYPKRVDNLFAYLQEGVISRDKSRIDVTDNGYSMKLDSYGDAGLDLNVELNTGEKEFYSLCSELPMLLQNVYPTDEKKMYRQMELNLGRVAKGENGDDNVGFMLHVAYGSERNYRVSVVFPRVIRSKLEKYGTCSAIDNTHPEAKQALLIRDTALEEGFDKTEEKYKCVVPVCPQPLFMDETEVVEFVKRSPWIKLEGTYWEKDGMFSKKSESVSVDVTPNHISIDGVSNRAPRYCARFTSEMVVLPLLKSAGVEFSPDSSIELNEKYTSAPETALKKAVGNDGLVGRVCGGAASAAFVLAAAPVAIVGLLGKSVYSITLEPYVEERKRKKSYFERVLTKGGIRRPGDSNCIAIINKTCLNEKYEIQKNSIPETEVEQPEIISSA